jgi:crossover junction endodeoxyribonuclease RuvC
MSQTRIAIGFDPGLATTGYGVVCDGPHGWKAVAGGIIETLAGTARADRLYTLHREAHMLIESHAPIGVAVEEVFFATNAQTAMRTAEARGVLLMAAQGVPIRGYTPLQVKKRVTGYGKASKRQVQEMVQRLLNLSALPRPDDVADALALALCYLLEEKGVCPRTNEYV